MPMISFQSTIGAVDIAGMAATTGTAGTELTTVTDTIDTGTGAIGDRGFAVFVGRVRRAARHPECALLRGGAP